MNLLILFSITFSGHGLFMTNSFILYLRCLMSFSPREIPLICNVEWIMPKEWIS